MNHDQANGVAVIGLGSMGIGIAQSLIRAGLKVKGFDVSPLALERLTGLGGEQSVSARAAATGAQAVVLVVVNAAQTQEVLFGEQGIAAVLGPGSVIISCATMSPADAERLADEAGRLGIHYLDAPISGGAEKAAQGALTVMASGAPAAFDRAQRVLDAIAQKIHRLGDRPGIGASVKMINQLLAGVHIAAACEAVGLASKLGLNLETVYEVITSSAGNSWMFENRIPHVLKGDYTPLSSIEIFVKDLGIVQDMVRTERYPAPIVAAALQMYLAAAGSGMGRDDDSSLARIYAGLAGVELPTRS